MTVRVWTTMTVPQTTPSPDDELLVERLDPRPRTARVTATATSRTSPTGSRCAGWPACPPSSPTSPRSSTASCCSSGSCWSASGPPAARSTPRTPSTELKLLAETAGSQVLEGLVQRRTRPDPATYIGRGKVAELRDVVVATGADTVICDGELAPGPAAQPGGPGQGQGDRPDGADPGHLRLSTPGAPRARPRSSWPSCSTSSSGCAAGAATCPGRPAVGPAAASASVAAVPARPSWRPTGAGSTAGSPSCGPLCARWTAPGRPSGPSGGDTRCRRWPSSATPTPASPACSTG